MRLVLADTFGNVFLVVAVLVIVGVAIGFLKLADNSRKGTVLLLALALFVVAPTIPTGDDRLMHGVVAIIGFQVSLGY
jgi:hypothetical protein